MFVCSLCVWVSHSLQPHGLYSLPGISVCGIFQARILDYIAISFSRGSFQPRDWSHISCISCIGRRILYQLHDPNGLTSFVKRLYFRHWVAFESLFIVSWLYICRFSILSHWSVYPSVSPILPRLLYLTSISWNQAESSNIILFFSRLLCFIAFPFKI